MAKRRKSRDHKPTERDAPRHRYDRAPVDPRWREPELLTDPHPRRIRQFDLWTDAFDLRTWHPDPVERPVAPWRPASRLVATPPSEPSRKSILGRFGGPPIRIGFARPPAVPICVRRQRRRQVMHALGLAGRRGLGRGKPQHRNAYSQIGC